MVNDYTTNFLTHLSELMRKPEIEVRGSKTREQLFADMSISMPTARIMMLPHRNDNPFAKVAETLWTLAGRNDVKWIVNYLPRAMDFSDNGLTWRGGYGPRLRNYSGANYTVDQLAHTINLLNADRNTRRAVMSLWDASEDWQPETLDTPCNNWAHFIIRDNALYLNIAQRSSDIWWGFSGVDFYFWSVLHQMMACWTNSMIGSIHYHMTSLHIYDRHWKQAAALLESIYIKFNPYIYSAAPDFITPWDKLESKLAWIFQQEAMAKSANKAWDGLEDVLQDDLLITFAQMLQLYWIHKDSTKDTFPAAYINAMKMSDHKLAAILYVLRSRKSLLSLLDLPEELKSELASLAI